MTTPIVELLRNHCIFKQTAKIATNENFQKQMYVINLLILIFISLGRGNYILVKIKDDTNNKENEKQADIEDGEDYSHDYETDSYKDETSISHAEGVESSKQNNHSQ